MQLTDIGTVKEIMERFGLNFKKKFGQNFLISRSVPADIAESCTPDRNCGILEIGPGIGTLTRELAARYRKVVAVEIDRDLIPALEYTLADFDNVKIIEGDIMKTDVAALCKREFTDAGLRFSVCANLPYYITTPVIMHLLESRAGFDYITIMIQKEVAARLCGGAGADDYGAITAAVAYFGKAEKCFNVSAGCFMPAPKVDSTVMRIQLYDTPPVDVKDEAMLFAVIRGAFAKRRKTLLNSLTGELGGLSREEINAVLDSAGIEPTVRGEKLSLEDFAKIANAAAKA